MMDKKHINNSLQYAMSRVTQINLRNQQGDYSIITISYDNCRVEKTILFYGMHIMCEQLPAAIVNNQGHAPTSQ